MHWQPDNESCPECSFNWESATPKAVGIVDSGPSDIEAALAEVPDPTANDGSTWSASMYVWHLVDMLRVGTERLVTLSLDPSIGIPGWDEKALASVRKYELLSPVVGTYMLRSATRDWLEAAEAAPEGGVVEHAELGLLDASAVIRRNAHEVHHHTRDIRRRQTL